LPKFQTLEKKMNDVLMLLLLTAVFIGLGFVLGRQSLKSRIEDANYKAKKAEDDLKVFKARRDREHHLSNLSDTEIIRRVSNTGRVDGGNESD